MPAPSRSEAADPSDIEGLRGLPAPGPPGEVRPGGAPDRTALVFCECGGNLGSVVRLSDLAVGGRWHGADIVAKVPVLCSPAGKAWLADRVREEGVRRLVVAGCSPLEHEKTFRGVLEGAGADPWLLQMVNLREQGEWVGGDAAQATARAGRLVSAALSRVRRQRPIERRRVEASGDAVVVGGGASGLSAALALARRGRQVVLVEREHALGGRLALLDRVFPGMECASCFVHPAVDEALHHPSIEVVTGAEVTEVRGGLGNFSVRVLVRPRRVDREACLGCATCASTCPVELPGGARAVGLPYPGALPHAAAVLEECLHLRGGDCRACADACPASAIRLGEAPAERTVRCGALIVATGLAPPPPHAQPGVLTAWQLERALHPDGAVPRRADGSVPRSVLLAPAPGARDGLWPEELAKLALLVRERLPEAAVAVAGGLDLTPRFEALCEPLRDAGVELLAGAADPDAFAAGGVRLSTGARAEADLLVVWETPRPSPGTAALAATLRIAAGTDGFLEERAGPFQPTASRVAGIFVAGGAAGPRPALAAIRDGVAAAGQVLSALEPGAPLLLEPLSAEVDPDRCGACGVCASACPSGAVALVRELGVSRVEPSFCHGCGCCAAACPSGAIEAPHFTTSQIAAEVSALLGAEPPAERRT